MHQDLNAVIPRLNAVILSDSSPLIFSLHRASRCRRQWLRIPDFASALEGRLWANMASMSNDRPFTWRSKLEAHKRIGKQLIAPFQGMGIPTQQIYWWRDILPEFLWVDSLVQAYGNHQAWALFGDFLTVADAFNPDANEILDGTVSAFRLVPEDRRQEFREELAPYVKAAVAEPFWPALRLYPECPMSWLVPQLTGTVEAAIPAVRDSVLRLMPGKDDHAGFCRSFPLHRMFAHKRLFILDTMVELAEAIEQYPEGDKWRVESFARQMHHPLFMQQAEKDPRHLDWSRSFWNSNLAITPCHYD
jgi:hypothetical protein